jgi:hypothetical protein
MNKAKISNKVQVEFSEEHLHVLVSALETYSRLQSGQIKMAIDEVYRDRNISYEEGQYIENVIRTIAFPTTPRRTYDGHGGFYDQYNNIYKKDGNILKESKEWQRKKHFPHLDYANASFGVGCSEMRDGTIAFEIKKIITQYLHYKRNNGYRDIMNVDGDGINTSYSGLTVPKIINFNPQKEFVIPKKFQKKIEELFISKNYNELWNVVVKAFNKKSLPKGKCSRVNKNKNGLWCVVVEEPIKSEIVDVL